MLEAVNSVLSNASYTKAIADQQSVATSYAANPARVQQAALQAPYISLYIKVDVNFDKALLQIRDRDTGDVVQQIPSDTQLQAYRRAQEVVAVKNSTYQSSVDVPGVEVPDVSAVPTQQEQVQAPSVQPTQTYTAPVATTSPAPQIATTVDTAA